MGRLRFGVHRGLEEEANRLLAVSLQGQSLTERRDVLTHHQETLRRRREVFVSTGTPDPAIRSGIYGRASNSVLSHLNSPGIVTASRLGRQDQDHSSTFTLDWLVGGS